MEIPVVKPIIIEIPYLTPPTVNHYKKPVTYRTSNGMRKGFALTPEAIAFHAAVALFARGQTLTPPTRKERDQVRYALAATVYLGAGERGDGDNFWKCLADGLKNAGVIHSDARVRSWHIDVEDGDRENPHTVVCAWIIPRDKTMTERIHELFGGK